MGSCRILAFVTAGRLVLPVEVAAETRPGAGGVAVAGVPRPVADAVAALMHGALAAMALSPPAAMVQIDPDCAEADAPAAQLAFPACVALLGAMALLPSVVGRFAAFGALRPDGSIAALPGVAQAAGDAAERGLGFLCAAEQRAEAGAAGCVDVIPAPDLLAIVNDFQGTQRQPRPWQHVGTNGHGFAEAPARFEPQRPERGADFEAKVGGFWGRLFGERRAERATGMAETAASYAEAPARTEPPPVALPFPTTGPTGHRARMRERVLERGTDSLADYEVLEMLLFLAFKTGDTKPLAKRLINRFGSFASVLSASQQELLETPGLGPHSVVALQLVRAAATRLALAELRDQPILNNWDRLMAYLTTVLARERVEQFRVLFLDNRNHLLADEAQARGTVNHTPVYPREVVKRTLELHATAIILVHNHPSGDPTPSREDVEMTHEIKQAAATLGVVLHDHVIVGNGSWLSFRKEGLL